MPSGHDPMGGNRFSEKITLRQKDFKIETAARTERPFCVGIAEAGQA
jgi:hypothetical protein